MKLLAKNIFFKGHNLNDIEKEVIVFIHGAGFDHTSWSLQTRYFANKGLPIVAVNLPGHGKSKGPSLDSITHMAECIINIIRNLKFKKACIIGHSMGSLVAIDLAEKYSSIIKKIVLIGSAKKMPVSTFLLDAAKNDFNDAIEIMVKFSLPYKVKLRGAGPPGMWLPAVVRRVLHNGSSSVLYNDLNACNQYVKEDNILKKIDAEAVVISGLLDQMTPIKEGEKLAKLLPNSILHRIKDSGHMLMLEQAREINNILKNFLKI